MPLVWSLFMLLVLFCWSLWLNNDGKKDRSMAQLNHSGLVVLAIGVVSLAICLGIQVAAKAGA